MNCMKSKEYQAFTETVLIEDVDRLKHALLDEYFGDKERPFVIDRSSRTLAGLIAAKRAVRRAIDRTEMPWHGITISYGENGKPFVERGEAVPGDCECFLSITHTRWAARAFVIFGGEECR